MCGEIALPAEEVPQVRGAEIGDPGIMGQSRQIDWSGGRIGLGHGAEEGKFQLGAQRRNAVIIHALIVRRLACCDQAR